MKRWWLPTQKGTELWPRTTVPPPKLVIEGVQTGTPLYREVAARFGGRLQQFHGKAQQQYSLAPQDVMKLRQDWGDARASYVNIQGQEILHLQVDWAVFNKGHEEHVDYWDYALIELYVPNMYYSLEGSRLTCFAHLTTPIEHELLPGDVWPVNGLAGNYLLRDTLDPMINAAENDRAVRVVSQDTEEAYASFIVDLRPARGLSVVTVDLHPYIYVNVITPNAPYWIGGTGQTPDPTHDEGNSPPGYDPVNYNYGPVNNAIGGSADGLNLWFPNADDPLNGFIGFLDYDATEYVGDFQVTPPHGVNLLHVYEQPAIHYDRTLGMVFDASGTKFYSQYCGERNRIPVNVGGITEWHTISGGWYTYWYVEGGPVGRVYSGPAPLPGDVQVTLFKGVPELDITRYEPDFGTAEYFDRWTYPQIYPRRVGFGTVARDRQIPVKANELIYDRPAVGVLTGGTVDEIYGVPKLGTVTIGLKTTEGASWSDA